MKITDVKLRILKSVREQPRKGIVAPTQANYALLAVTTDEGIDGHTMSFQTDTALLRMAVPELRMSLAGRDPWDIEAIWHENCRVRAPGWPAITGMIDICLWDIVAQKAGVPLYKLLGAYRDKIRAYSSPAWCETDQEYIDTALQNRDEGFTAYKFHPYHVVADDIRLCRAVREAVGDTMDLMLDPVSSYDRKGALEVGRVLDELKFYWFEDPIPNTDVEGLIDLTSALDIQISIGEDLYNDPLHTFPQYLARHVGDSIRPNAHFGGGISVLKKVSALCDAFNTNCELYNYGPTLLSAAFLHVGLATRNCDFIAVATPKGIVDPGMKDIIWIEKDGYVHAPTKPGLGYDIDWDEIDRLTIEEV